MTQPSPAVRAHELTKHYGSRTILRRIGLEISAGEARRLADEGFSATRRAIHEDSAADGLAVARHRGSGAATLDRRLQERRARGRAEGRGGERGGIVGGVALERLRLTEQFGGAGAKSRGCAWRTPPPRCSGRMAKNC